MATSVILYTNCRLQKVHSTRGIVVCYSVNFPLGMILGLYIKAELENVDSVRAVPGIRWEVDGMSTSTQ